MRTPRGLSMTLLVLTGLAGFGVPARADDIRLKNGETLQGTIEQEDDQGVTVRIEGVGTMTFQRSEIKSITPSSAAPAQAQEPAAETEEEQGEWKTFRSRRRALKLTYPKTWHVMETINQFPYAVTIEPAPPNPDIAAAAPLVIELFKYYHLSTATQFGQGSPEEILNRFVTTVLTATGQAVQIISRRDITVQGVPGKLVELKATDKRSAIPLQLYALVAVKDDVLSTVFCQSPEQEFETHRAMCEEVVKRVEPFSAGRPDNELLDTESAKLTQQAVDALKAGDAKTVMEKFEQALRINPGDALTHMNYGSLLMQFAGAQPQGNNQVALLARAEGELMTAASMFQVNYKSKLAPAVSQTLFLLGEIQYFGRQDPAKAKPFYEQSLKFWNHGGAQEALKRYGGT